MPSDHGQHILRRARRRLIVVVVERPHQVWPFVGIIIRLAVRHVGHVVFSNKDGIPKTIMCRLLYDHTLDFVDPFQQPGVIPHAHL
eukprot:8377741-Pyramimonas_sp.AAC.2